MSPLPASDALFYSVESLIQMLVLGIESSCDETAAAIVRDGREMLSSVISSQIEIHKRFGGVVPDFSFSGLKTAVSKHVRETQLKPVAPGGQPTQAIKDLAASF